LVWYTQKGCKNFNCYGKGRRVLKYYCLFICAELLWPGNQDYALRYRERLYYFSSEEAKDKFAENPTAYIAKGKPLKVCGDLLFEV